MRCGAFKALVVQDKHWNPSHDALSLQLLDLPGSNR